MTKPWMAFSLYAVVAASVGVALAKSSAPREKAALVARGEHLVAANGCAHCHTPKRFDEKLGVPVPDPTKFLAGHPAGSPEPSAPAKTDSLVANATMTGFHFAFGRVYASNLTPDPSGLGGWTEEQFISALRTGRHMGGTGRPILPPMPWESIRLLDDDDLHAIFAYLRTIPPVKNEVPVRVELTWRPL